MKKTLLVLLILSLIMPMAIFAGGKSETGDKVVEIEFFQRKREVVDLFDTLIADFEAKNPGITVEQIHVADHDQVLASRLAANKVPDVLTHWPNKADYKETAKAGFFVDLTDLDVTENCVPEIVNQIRLSNGKNYAVPISVNTQGVFYNKDLFAAKGYEIPKSWDELMTLVKAIKADEEVAFVWPDGTDFPFEHQFRSFLNLNSPNAEKMMDEIQAGKKKAQDYPELKTIAEMFFTLREYGQDDMMGTSYEQAAADFANGKAYMFAQGIWVIPSVQKANPDINFSSFALPSITGQPTRVEYGVDLALVIGNTGDEAKMEASKVFVKFLASKETAQKYADSDGSPSAIKGVEFKNEISKPLVDMVQEGKAFRNIRHRWVAGGPERSRTATQQLIVDGDVDAWLEELNAIFGHPDYK